MMKYFMFFLLAIVAFSCKKETTDHSELAFYYGETQCADAWQTGAFETGSVAHENAIKSYLTDSLDVTFTSFTLVKENDEAVCLACTCTNGYVIRFKSTEDDKADLLAAGFKLQ